MQRNFTDGRKKAAMISKRHDKEPRNIVARLL
jgi:hypothetical protein